MDFGASSFGASAGSETVSVVASAAAASLSDAFTRRVLRRGARPLSPSVSAVSMRGSGASTFVTGASSAGVVSAFVLRGREVRRGFSFVSSVVGTVSSEIGSAVVCAFLRRVLRFGFFSSAPSVEGVY